MNHLITVLLLSVCLASNMAQDFSSYHRGMELSTHNIFLFDTDGCVLVDKNNLKKALLDMPAADQIFHLRNFSFFLNHSNCNKHLYSVIRDYFESGFPRKYSGFPMVRDKRSVLITFDIALLEFITAALDIYRFSPDHLSVFYLADVDHVGELCHERLIKVMHALSKQFEPHPALIQAVAKLTLKLKNEYFVGELRMLLIIANL